MRVSLSWICNLLGVERLPTSTDDLVTQLTAHLAEIEHVESAGPQLEGVVCGQVLTCEQHPDADRLRCTTVDVGTGTPLSIVCGAPNVAAGQSVAVATVGTTLSMTAPDGSVQSLKIKKGKLRGQPSHGMICAEDELGLGDNHDGILVLDGQPQPGTPLTTHLQLGDEVIVVDNHNINHRPDLWGHHGWAREIAALLDMPAPAELNVEWHNNAKDVTVGITDPDCLAYRGAVITGVSNQASPDWMRQRLEACGIRPLGLLVDVTNYVMLETGEPMHAFDHSMVTSSPTDDHQTETIVVRRAHNEETFTTLDGQNRQLTTDDLVIAINGQVAALAGIMGGEDSGVTEQTTEIILEAATFRAATVRRSRIRHGLATDSASRFEKHLPTELTAAAINRAISLLSAECPALTVTSTFSAGATGEPTQAPTIPFDPTAMARLVGMDVPVDQQTAILTSLGFSISDHQVSIPWWRRRDVENGADLVEEVARIRGYDQVVPEVPRLPTRAPEPNDVRNCEHILRRGLAARGWHEVQTYGFTSTTWAQALAWPEDQTIALAHPLASDQSVLRCSLLPTLLEAAGRNRRFQDAVHIFEVGKCYGLGHGLLDSAPAGNSTGSPARGHRVCEHERLVVAGVICDKSIELPFYHARDAARAALASIGCTAELRAIPADDQASARLDVVAGRCAELCINGQTVATISEVPAALADAAGLSEPAAWFSIELERVLVDHGLPAPQAFQSPSRYQRVERDFTFICPETLSFGELATVAGSASRGLSQQVALAQPVFRDEQLGADLKAVSIRVTLQANDRTLSDKELTKISKSIIGAVEHKTPARLKQ